MKGLTMRLFAAALALTLSLAGCGQVDGDPIRSGAAVLNLVSVLANKILLFNDKITHVSKRTTREKLLSYLSAESIRQSSLSFDIPFDRQQLADFLCVERAAMSVELSKLQKEGLLVTKRNHFELLTR